MSSAVLRIKRSLVTATPTTLVQGELAYSELSQNLFFGSSQGVIKIGGLSDVTKLANATALATPNTLVFRDGSGSIAVHDITVEGDLIVTGNQVVNGTTQYIGDTVFDGDIFVNGGDIKTTASTTSIFSQPNVSSIQVGHPTNTTLIAPTTIIKSKTTQLAGNPAFNVFSVVDSNDAPLFEVRENGDTVIANVLTVNGDGTSTFAGNVSIGGSLTVAENATVTMDFAANNATITGNLFVNGNTNLGNEATDVTTITGKTVIDIGKTMATASPTADAFLIKTSDNNPLFQVKENGDTVIAGVLTVNGTGTSTFAGDVAIGGSITVAENATVTADFTANTMTVTGDLMVNGDTRLGNEATDTTDVTGTLSVIGSASVKTTVTKAAGSPTVDAFVVKSSDNLPLFEVKQNGDTVIAGVLTVNGDGTSTFAGDVAIGGSITVAENATVTMDFTANDATITGNLVVNGNTSLGNDVNDTLSVTGNTDFGGNVTIAGNLTVNGTTTTVNSTTTTLTDPVLSLAQDTTTDDTFDRGVDFKWHNGTSVKTGFFGFDDSTEKFTFIPDASVTDGVYSGAAGTIVATRFEGLADRAERLETARTIALAGDVTGSVSFDGTQNVTITATIAADSVALGTDTTGQYAKTLSVSGLGLTSTTPQTQDGTDYVVTSNATVDATANTLVYRGTQAEVKAGFFVSETGVSRFKAGIDGLAADGTTKTELTNFVIDGGTF